MPGSRRYLFLFRFPGVEPVPFGAANARPLDLRERDVDGDARHGLAVESDGHQLGLETVPGVIEQWDVLHADVPRGWVDDDAGAVGEVLTRDVFDVAFESVGVRDPRFGVRPERKGKFSSLQRSLVSLHL